jgi:hypothetical protein
MDYARDRIHPRHGNRRSSLCDHDGILVDFGYFLDEFVGSSRKSECFPIIAFRLEIGVKTDNSDHEVRLPGQLHGLVHEVVRVTDLRTAKPDASAVVHNSLILVPICRSTDVAEFDANLMAFVRLKVIDATFFHRTDSEEVVPAALASPIIDHQVTVYQ